MNNIFVYNQYIDHNSNDEFMSGYQMLKKVTSIEFKPMIAKNIY